MHKIIMELRFKIKIPVKVDNDKFIGKKIWKTCCYSLYGKRKRTSFI